MKRSHDHLGIKVLLAAGMVVFGLVGLAPASPWFGGQCSYCHTNEAPDALKIEGFTSIEEETKVFEVAPGDTVDFTFNVDEPGDPEYYWIALRGLDLLNGSDENGVVYAPKMYTADEDWATKGNVTQSQYLFREGQFYVEGPSDAAESFDFTLVVSADAEPGVYPLNVNLGGGSPMSPQLGAQPQGGWYFQESFNLRVVPEPGSALLLMMGVVMLGSIRRWGRKSVTLAVVLMAGLVTTNVAQAYPSRTGRCDVCHNIPGPAENTGDFEILDSDATPTDEFTASPGETVEFRFDFTQLVEQGEGEYGRGYLIIDKIDQLSVGTELASLEEIMYTESKYTVNDDDHLWHVSRQGNRYIGEFGQYFAQSSSDPEASMVLSVTLHEDVALGDYEFLAHLAGGQVGRGEDAASEGWYVKKNFTLSVVEGGAGATVTIPEPGSLVLLGLTIPFLLRLTRRRR
jgi:hypothetical protein